MQPTRLQRLLLTVLLLLVTGCSGGAGGGPTPTFKSPGCETDQPTYTVQRDPVTHPLEFTARVAPVQEATLFFRADGHLARLLEARDVVTGGMKNGRVRLPLPLSSVL